MRSSLKCSVIALVLWGSPLPAAASDSWSLGGAVPDKVFMCVHTVRTQEEQFLRDYWAKVWQALRNAGLQNDLKALIVSNLGEADQAGFNESWALAEKLFAGVDWLAFVEGNEFVYAQALKLPTPSHLFLSRTDRKITEKNFAGLKAILDQLASLAPDELIMKEFEAHGATGCRLQLGDEVTIGLARRGDVIVACIEGGAIHIKIGSGDKKTRAKDPQDIKLFDQALRLLDGDESVGRLIDLPAFKATMAKLPKPECERFFMDAENLLTSLHKFCDEIEKLLGAQDAEEAQQAASWLRTVHKLVDQFAFFESVGSVTTMDGYSRHVYEVTLLTPDAMDKPLFKALCGGKPIKQFDKYLPKQATAFSVSSGTDFGAFYEAITDFVRDDVPGGQETLAMWAGIQEQIGFNVEKDLLSWLGNEFISVSMPPAIPSPFGGADWVMMIQVTDEAKAKATVDRGLAALMQIIKQKQAPPLTTQPANNPSLEGFLTLTHPMMMMFLRPVYGVADGYMIIGSSEKAILRCLKTARGENPSIRKNKRFIEEGLIPTGPATAVSFKDLSNLGQEIAQVLGLLGMVGNMVPTDDDAAEIIRPIFGMLQKLAPVVAQINFYKSKATVTMSGARILKTHTVTHYKEPPRPEETSDQDVSAGEKAQAVALK